jgi:DNA-binding transcriptional MerR regulator
MRYRVDELAARAGVSVDTVRFYQSKGLLPSPERDGRRAWYSDEHLDVLGRIRDLKEQGFNLGSIARVLAGDLAPADRALVEAVAAPARARGSEERWLTLDELAEATGVSRGLLEAIEREGLLVPTFVDGEPRYGEGDKRAVASGLQLLEAGVPLHELLELARAHENATRSTAERAVELFDRYVRQPVKESEPGPDTQRHLVEAFSSMFDAATALVSHQFGRLLLEEAQDKIEREALRNVPMGSVQTTRRTSP